MPWLHLSLALPKDIADFFSLANQSFGNNISINHLPDASLYKRSIGADANFWRYNK
jgi:hypothetical protein